jgi:hypothetical protein
MSRPAVVAAVLPAVLVSLPQAMQANALLVVVRLSVVAELVRVTLGENTPACTFPSIPLPNNQYEPSCTYVPTATCLLVFMHVSYYACMHYRKLRLCLGFQALPRAFYQALGKEILCRVPHSAQI